MKIYSALYVHQKCQFVGIATYAKDTKLYYYIMEMKAAIFGDTGGQQSALEPLFTQTLT